MRKHGYKFRRDYSIKVIPAKTKKVKFGRVSTRKQQGGEKNEAGLYLNPVQVKRQLDNETILLEDGRAVTLHNGITYLSCGDVPEE